MSKNLGSYLTVTMFTEFLSKLGVSLCPREVENLITNHSGECFKFKEKWESEIIPFPKGVAIYLLTYLDKWCESVRQTPTGYLYPDDWVIINKNNFLSLLPDIPREENGKYDLFFSTDVLRIYRTAEGIQIKVGEHLTFLPNDQFEELVACLREAI